MPGLFGTETQDTKTAFYKTLCFVGFASMAVCLPAGARNRRRIHHLLPFIHK